MRRTYLLGDKRAPCGENSGVQQTKPEGHRGLPDQITGYCADVSPLTTFQDLPPSCSSCELTTHEVKVLVFSRKLRLELVKALVAGAGGQLLETELGLERSEHFGWCGCVTVGVGECSTCARGREQSPSAQETLYVVLRKCTKTKNVVRDDKESSGDDESEDGMHDMVRRLFIYSRNSQSGPLSK